MSDSGEKAKVAVSAVSGVATSGFEMFVFSHFLKQSMEKALFQASLKNPAFAVMAVFSALNWFIDLIDYKTEQDPVTKAEKFKNLVFGGVITVISIVAIIIALTTTLIAAPILFVVSFATVTAKAVFEAGREVYRAFTDTAENMSVHLKRAAAHFIVAVSMGLMTGAVAKLMVVTAGVASKAWGGIILAANGTLLGLKIKGLWGRLRNIGKSKAAMANEAKGEAGVKQELVVAPELEAANKLAIAPAPVVVTTARPVSRRAITVAVDQEKRPSRPSSADFNRGHADLDTIDTPRGINDRQSIRALTQGAGLAASIEASNAQLSRDFGGLENLPEFGSTFG